MAAAPTAIESALSADNPQETLETGPPAVSPYGPKNEKLPRQLREAIEKATRRAQQDNKWARRQEVMRDRKLRLYELGRQHVYEGRDGCFALAIPGGQFLDQNGQDQEWGEYIDDYNIFHGFIWILMSVLTQNGPGIAWEPLNPSQSEDEQAAETAEGLRLHFDRVNDIKKIMRQIVRFFCLSGRMVMWVKTEANASRWGRDNSGNPRKNQTCEVFGAIETKVPLLEKGVEDFWYLLVYKDADVHNARQNHPLIAKKIKPNSGALDEGQYERYARLGVLQGMSGRYQATNALTNMVTELHAFLRPAAFSDEECDKPFEEATPEMWIKGESGMRPPSVREALERTFSQNGGFTGIHAVFMGDQYSMAFPETMDDCLIVEQPFVGDGQAGMAIMDPAVIAQDRFNTLMNYIAETFDFGAPSTWVLASKTEFEAIVRQAAQVGGFRQFKALGTNTNSVADNLYREPHPEVPQSLDDVIRFLMTEFLQFVLACPPAMWGESTDDTKTASGLAQSRNQALGRVGIVWAALQKVMAKMYYQVALSASADPDTPEEIIVPVAGGQNRSVKVERLRKGHFMTMPDEDSGFPDSTAAKRATLMTLVQMIAQFPLAAQQFFAAPANWKQMLRLFGISEMVLPEAESHDKQVAEIEELLLGVPIMPTPEEVAAAQMAHDQESSLAAQAGQAAMAIGGIAPPPPAPFDPASLIRSSVSVQPWDFDQWEMQACDDYLNSQAARTELKIGRLNPETGEMEPNIRGIENVWAHRQEHARALAAKNPMPQAPVVAGKGGAGEPPSPMGGLMPESAAAGSPGTQTV